MFVICLTRLIPFGFGGGKGGGWLVGDVLRTEKAGVCILNPIPRRGYLYAADVGRDGKPRSGRRERFPGKIDFRFRDAVCNPVIGVIRRTSGVMYTSNSSPRYIGGYRGRVPTVNNAWWRRALVYFGIYDRKGLLIARSNFGIVHLSRAPYM